MTKIGIVYSPDFGAGWSTWNDPKQALDQEMAKAIERKAPMEEIDAIARANWPDAYVSDLPHEWAVKWVEKGTEYHIDEYDGAESVILENDLRIAE